MKWQAIEYTGVRGNQTLRLMIAASMFARMRGLLWRSPLTNSEGMLLQPCMLVHTFGMQYAIDVVFLGRGGRILNVVEALAPRRVCGNWRARGVLEMASGEARRCGIEPGGILPIDTMRL